MPEIDGVRVLEWSKGWDAWFVHQVVSHTSQEISDGLEGQFPENIGSREYILPDCVIEKNGAVFINLDYFLDRGIFLSFLENIFDNWYYLTDVDYQLLNDMLYDSERIELLRKDKQGKNGSSLVQIASSIKKFDESRRTLYRKPKVSLDHKSADYFFDSVYLEGIDDNGKIQEIKSQIKFDEFVAAMWSEGIRFGLDFENIQKIINEGQIVRYTIAHQKEPSGQKDASLEPVISFEIKRGAKEGATANRVDILNYEQSYIRVEKDVKIYRKNPRKLWFPGWTIQGEIIRPEDPQDISLYTFLGDGTREERVDGADYIISNHSGFPRLEEGTVISGKTRKKWLVRVHIDEKKVFHEIGMDTGKVDIQEDVISNQNIVLDTWARTILAKKDVEANLYAKSDITIEWNVIGTAHNNIVSQQHQKVTGISKWNIVSENWSIGVAGHANDTYLEAKKWTVTVWNISNSMIIGHIVEITGMVFNTTIVADIIILKWRVIGSRLIAGKEIRMHESTEKWDNENVISIFSCDLTASIEKKQVLRNKEIQKIQILEAGIDKKILEKFQWLSKFEEGKRRSITRILIEIMQDPSKLQLEEYKSYVALYNAIEPVLKKNGTDWKVVAELNKNLTNLSKEIQVEQEAMESSKKDTSINIAMIRWTTHIQHMIFLSNKNISSFTKEEVEQLSRLIAGRDILADISLEKLTTSSTGSFHWKSNPL